MKFTIERDKWLRGNESNSCLLNDRGKRCCLGFFGQACGLTDNQLLSKSAPGNVGMIGSDEWNRTMFLKTGEDFVPYLHSMEANMLMRINDGTKYTDEERERLIIEEFAKLGIEVEFK